MLIQNKETKWLEFISGINTIMITNEEEFNKFRDFLTILGLDELLKNENTFSDWQHLSEINGKDPNCIIFEFQLHKGMTFGYTKESSKNWYGKEPLTVEVIDNFFKKLEKLRDENRIEIEEEIEK